MAVKEIFKRYDGNPIMTLDKLPYEASSVFNAGATEMGGQTILLMRVEDKRGISHLTVAKSKNGLDGWVVDEKPSFLPSPETHPEEIWGIEDPRITYLDELNCWAVVYTAYSESGPLVSLACTRDFSHFERYGALLPPENKDAALFPRRFKGHWAMIHRPVCYGSPPKADIWLSFSPDLRHWGSHRLLIPARKGAWWDSNKIGLAPPPLATEEGWLILYHGVKATVNGGIYRLGLALLDLEDPRRVIARSSEWVFSPQEGYEMTGDVDKVVFPCGWIRHAETVRLYYGGADKCVALATAEISELLEWLKEHNTT